MHEGQIEEFAQDRVDPRIDAAIDRTVRHVLREVVAGIGPAVATKDVAGKLVEHDDQRQRAVIAFFP